MTDFLGKRPYLGKAPVGDFPIGISPRSYRIVVRNEGVEKLFQEREVVHPHKAGSRPEELGGDRCHLSVFDGGVPHRSLRARRRGRAG
jgi:hypothetical protein